MKLSDKTQFCPTFSCGTPLLFKPPRREKNFSRSHLTLFCGARGAIMNCCDDCGGWGVIVKISWTDSQTWKDTSCFLTSCGFFYGAAERRTFLWLLHFSHHGGKNSSCSEDKWLTQGWDSQPFTSQIYTTPFKHASNSICEEKEKRGAARKQPGLK